MTLPAPPTVSVVIPTYDRCASLPATLRPLLDSPGAHELIVVVDGCEDGSLELLQSLARDDARLRPLWVENGGAASARLAGVRAATGDVVLLLDDDVVATPGLVAGHARRHAGRDALLVVGYMPVAQEGRRTRDDFPLELYAREYERHCERWEADPATVTATLWSGNMSLRREDHLAVEEQRPAAGVSYHEDLDFGLRCEASGISAVFDRSLAASHRYQRTPEQFLRDARNSGASRRRVHELHEDLLGPLSPRFGEEMVPGPFAPVVRFCSGRPRARALAWRGTHVCGALGLHKPQRLLAMVTWACEARLAAGLAGQTTP